jgi:hypothetical protein
MENARGRFSVRRSRSSSRSRFHKNRHFARSFRAKGAGSQSNSRPGFFWG